MRMMWCGIAVIPLAISGLAGPPATVVAQDSRPVVFADLAYPPEALAARVSGLVVVRVATDAAGHVVVADALGGAQPPGSGGDSEREKVAPRS